jgi:hypothetical protein
MGIDLGNITFSSISGTVTTDGSSPVTGGNLRVFSQPAASVSDFNSQTARGEGQITNGTILGGYASITSGYVGIYSYDDYSTYITSSPVTLGSSMSFNLSEMTPLSY